MQNVGLLNLHLETFIMSWMGHDRRGQTRTSASNECPPTMWWYNFKLQKSCDSILVSHPCVLSTTQNYTEVHNISWHTRTPSCNKLQKIISLSSTTTKTWHFAKKLCVAWELYFYVVLMDKSFGSGWEMGEMRSEKWRGIEQVTT